MARKMWFAEYYRQDSGEPVNLSIGLTSLDDAVHRGKLVCRIHGYCGFWVLSKDSGTIDRPHKVVYYGCTVDPRGNIQWRKPPMKWRAE